jgi:hypothetical protein
MDRRKEDGKEDKKEGGELAGMSLPSERDSLNDSFRMRCVVEVAMIDQ